MEGSLEPYNLVSFAGVFILVFFAFLLSPEKHHINWRVVCWGVGLQFLVGFFLFVLPAGQRFFLVVNDLVVEILDCAGEGSRFLFGPLAAPAGEKNSLGFILAFQALPAIIFFSSLVSVLYHLGVLPWLIRLFSVVFTRLMRVSGAESLCVSSNIFVGIESALTIRPYIARMTRSELLTILTAGMSTIASSVLAFYTFILREEFPNIAGHLVSASLLSAPAAFVMAKLLLPETGHPETLGITISPYYEKDSSIMEAIISGANAGVRLVTGIAALLVAFLGLAALVNLGFGAAGSLVNTLTGWSTAWTLEGMMSIAAYPLTIVIGVPPPDAPEVARLIGERLILTEVPSYMDLAALIETRSFSFERSIVIATYALCGFAHIAAMAIFTGGISAIAPEKSKEIASLSFRALFAATLACLLTAAVAGTFYSSGGILLYASG